MKTIILSARPRHIVAIYSVLLPPIGPLRVTDDGATRTTDDGYYRVIEPPGQMVSDSGDTKISDDGLFHLTD